MLQDRGRSFLGDVVDEEGDQRVDGWDWGGQWWGYSGVYVFVALRRGDLFDSNSNEAGQSGVAGASVTAIVVENPDEEFWSWDLTPCSDGLGAQSDQEFPGDSSMGDQEVVCWGGCEVGFVAQAHGADGYHVD